MRALILGTAGHIDHGKTELVRALTGTDTDRLPEEKRRGITIDIGFARLPLDDDTEFGIVDVPGHEAFVRNMLAGATGVDVALLVIAADEGVMPQTREHLAILDLLAVHAAVIALTKVDLVTDPAWLELVGDDTRELLRGGPFADAPIIPVSARTGAGLDDLRTALRDAAARAHRRSSDDAFRMPVDRVFSVQGTGTVVTGTVWTGRVEKDQTLTHLPGGQRFRVRGVQTHGRTQEHAGAGERAALALAGATRDVLARGHWLLTGNGWTESHMLTVRLRALDGHAFRNRQRVRVHLGTGEVLARIALLDHDEIDGGAWAQLRLEQPIVARAGDRFVIRAYSPVTTIGGGRVAEPLPPKRKRIDHVRRTFLHAILAGDPPAAVAAAVSLAGWRGLGEDSLDVHTPHPPALAAIALQQLVENGTIARTGTTLLAAGHLEEAVARILDRVREYHAAQPLRPGLDMGELRACVPARAPAELVDAALRTLAGRGLLEIRRNLVSLAGFQPRLDPEQGTVARRIVQILDDAGLAPPTTAELPPELRARPDLEDLLHHLERAGDIRNLGAGLHFASAHLRDAEEKARHALTVDSALGPGAFRELYGVTRKHLIPILEHLDRTGVTVRVGDLRRAASPSHVA
jgi:selenocysteine-specific elongation factor